MTSSGSPAPRSAGPSLAHPERELVDAILRKDRKATAEFVSAHADAVYSYVRGRLIPRIDLVDDVVQEVFLAAWEKLPQFRAEAPLRHWLMGIARHKVEDYYRSRLRQPDCQIDEDLPASAAPQAAPGPDERLDREKRHTRTRQVLQSLPEPYALVLLWRYWEKRSTQDIAAETGKTEKAVERMLARARAQFRRRWDYA